VCKDLLFNTRWRVEDAAWLGDGSGATGNCFGECDSELIQRGKKEWWVQVKTDAGVTGWVLADGNFDGMDACGSQ
jgi:hypothetical protein